MIIMSYPTKKGSTAPNNPKPWQWPSFFLAAFLCHRGAQAARISAKVGHSRLGASAAFFFELCQ